MMNKFKVGDNVITNRQVDNVPKGTIGVVIESPAPYWSQTEGFSVRFENFNLGHNAGHGNDATDCWNFFANDAYKLDRLEFKVGDRVRLKDPKKYGNHWDRVLTVAGASPDKTVVGGAEPNSMHGVFDPSELKLVCVKKETKMTETKKKYIVKAEDARVYDDIEKAQKTAEYLNKIRDGRKFYVVEVSNTYKRKEKLVKTVEWEKE